MGTDTIAAALQRLHAILERRPEAGAHDDAPAATRWAGGTRIVASHANGMQLSTDMPVELGGSGDQVTPGWLFRAGLASCAATSILLSAAAEGIELTMLEVNALSRSDTRGLLGVPDPAGAPVPAGPHDVQLQVRIAARGIDAGRLRELVQHGLRRSPIPNALTEATPLALHIDVATA